MTNAILKGAATAAAILGVSSAWAGGFEKNVMWSGQYSGLGGAAASNVVGSESIFFNPAGLTKGEGTHEVTFNISPTFSQAEGPLFDDNDQEEAEDTFSPIYGLTYRWNANEKWSLGAGVYISAGTSFDYQDKAIPGTAITAADATSALNATEIALGGAYQIDDNWSVGLAWRMALVDAEFATVGDVQGTNLPLIKFDDISGQAYDGFKIGTQYRTDTWGVGLNYRSRLIFEAEGSENTQVRNVTDNSVVTTISGDVEITSELPQQVALGGHYQFSDDWTGYFEYVWTEYSKIQRIVFDRTAGTDIPLTTDWKDQSNFRFAGQYTGWGMPLRLGYVLTTAVVPENRARATFSTPGLGHTFTVGSGWNIGMVMVNGALEYSFSEGDINNAESNAGDYSTSAIAAHLGATVSF